MPFGVTSEPRRCGALAKPGSSPLGVGTDIVNVRCESLRFSYGGSLTDLSDDVFVPLCVGYSANDSRQDCAAALTCTEATEACVGAQRELHRRPDDNYIGPSS